MTMDRTYWHVPGARSWHANADGVQNISLCGRWPRSVIGFGTATLPDHADRLPPTAHLCGNCSRIIAARTDIEPPRKAADDSYVSDVPEPVASEQDDSGIAPV